MGEGSQIDELSREERVVRVELAFRRANEALYEVFEEASLDELEDAYPFLCECGDRHCTEIVPTSLDLYRSVREQPTWFLILAGHKQLASERVVEADDPYEIVEKGGRGGELARLSWAELAPRA